MTNPSLLMRAGWAMETLAWDGVFGLLRALNLVTASDVAAGVLAGIRPLVSANATARRNIQLAFPDITPRDLKQLLDASWNNIGYLAAEFAHMKRLPVYGKDSPITVENVEALDALRESSKPAVFISGHFSNWEFMPAAIAQRGVPCRMTYRAANNPAIDDRILDVRRGYGADLQAPKGADGARELLEALNANVSVALMNDQKFNDGIETTFFGHACMTAPGPSRLAMRFKAPLLPMSTKRLAKGKFLVRVHEPIPQSTNPDKFAGLRETVQSVTDFMEARVRETPEQWFWVHRRWPKEAWVKAGLI